MKMNPTILMTESIKSEKIELIAFIGGAGLNIAGEFYELLSEFKSSHMSAAQTLAIRDYTYLNTQTSSPYSDFQFAMSWNFASLWNRSFEKRIEIARSELDSFRELISESCNSVCVVSALGGHTGTFAGGAIAEIALEEQVPVTRVLLMPFKFEGSRRLLADEFLSRTIQKCRMCDVVLDNSDAYEVLGHKTKVPKAMSYLNKRAAKAICTQLGWI